MSTVLSTGTGLNIVPDEPACVWRITYKGEERQEYVSADILTGKHKSQRLKHIKKYGVHKCIDY